MITAQCDNLGLSVRNARNRVWGLTGAQLQKGLVHLAFCHPVVKWHNRDIATVENASPVQIGIDGSAGVVAICWRALAARMARGPNRAPGRKETEVSKGTPSTATS